jgi:hypothetical protein
MNPVRDFSCGQTGIGDPGLRLTARGRAASGLRGMLRFASGNIRRGCEKNCSTPGFAVY